MLYYSEKQHFYISSNLAYCTFIILLKPITIGLLLLDLNFGDVTGIYLSRLFLYASYLG